MITHFVTILALGGFAVSAAVQSQKPLPDTTQLLKRSRASLLQSEKDLEKYSCTVLQKTQQLNDDKTVKKEKSTLKERFYVNGVQLEHTLARNGSTLTGRDARKEQEHVDNDVRRFSDPRQASGEIDRSEKQEDLFLRALRFMNGRRETRDNRSIVVYDLSGDPAFRPHKLEERFAQTVVGRVWIDEDSGQPLELQFRTDKDLKIAGGLFANLHKGFQLHLLRQRQPDGVWMTKSVDGSGEGRAALFFHERFHFIEGVSQCHLFSVETKQKVEAPK